MLRSLTIIYVLTALATCSQALAGPRTDVVKATYRVAAEGSTATAFVIHREDAEGKRQRFLVTAAHVLSTMQGENMTLLARHQDEDAVSRVELSIAIRKGDEALWTAHPDEDIAVLPLADDVDPIESIPMDMLATPEDWREQAWEPGTAIWSIGFPHGAIFDPDPRGYPLTRQGCLATFPHVPTAAASRFTVEYNTFEGDSGGPVLLLSESDRSQGWVIGLVHGQHFINDNYKLVYSEGTTRHRLGMCIVIGSPLIRETIESVIKDKSND